MREVKCTTFSTPFVGYLVLDADSIGDQATVGSHRLVVAARPLREATVARNVNLHIEKADWSSITYNALLPTFCLPGNLNFALLRASMTLAL